MRFLPLISKCGVEKLHTSEKIVKYLKKFRIIFLIKKKIKELLVKKKKKKKKATRDSTGLASALSPYADYAQNFPKLKKRFKD